MIKFVSIEQRDIAKQVDLIAFLEENHPEVIEYNNRYHNYRGTINDSICFYPYGYYRFSKGEGGDAIRYLMEYLNYTYQDAVIALFRFGTINGFQHKDYFIFDYNEPEYNKNFNKLYSYLIGRGIERTLIDDLIDNGCLYEDIAHHVVFANYVDEFFILKETSKYKFNQIIRRKPHQFWYFIKGDKPKTVIVCESPIDAMSVYCLTHRDGVYCAMGGLKHKTLRTIMDEYQPHWGYQYLLGVDWDDKGNEFALKHPSIRRIFSNVGKDWNDVLLHKLKK